MVRMGFLVGFAALLATAAGVAHAMPQTEPRQIQVDPKLFDSYVGFYQLAPDLVLTVSREGNHLLVQNTKGPRVELLPSGERDYFYKDIPVQVSFDTGRDGKAVQLIVHENGKGLPAKRIDERSAKLVEELSKPDIEVAVDPMLFELYAGSYQLSPTTFLTVTLANGHLFGEVTGQERQQLYPKSTQTFFLKVADVQITFLPDERGSMSKAVLHQRGHDLPGVRVDETTAKQVAALTAARLADQQRERKAIALDSNLLDRYTGHYRLRPDFVVTISRKGEHLFAQGTSQGPAEILPESEHGFFFKEVPAQITFIADEQKPASQMIIHQDGMEFLALRDD